MSLLYIISDLHFGHKNMAIKRGFIDATEHDKHIITEWNKVIKKKDVVWILGDITMEKISPYPLLLELNGLKKIILGNHDLPQHTPKLLEYVNWVGGMYNYKDLIFTHCPIHPLEMQRYRKNVHGHVHENTIPNEKYINVCCEIINYKPILINSI